MVPSSNYRSVIHLQVWAFPVYNDMPLDGHAFLTSDIQASGGMDPEF